VDAAPARVAFDAVAAAAGVANGCCRLKTATFWRLCQLQVLFHGHNPTDFLQHRFYIVLATPSGQHLN